MKAHRFAVAIQVLRLPRLFAVLERADLPLT